MLSRFKWICKFGSKTYKNFDFTKYSSSIIILSLQICGKQDIGRYLYVIEIKLHNASSTSVLGIEKERVK